ncbi:MAG: hypothetical protein K2M41_09430 [Muribaculaceae bacterium]|nr:hypothetical protein [Muribaculaceae bacterium]
MRNFSISILISMICINICAASEHLFSFSESEYTLITSTSGITEIAPVDLSKDYFSDDTDAPALPKRYCNLIIPYGSIMTNYSVEHTKPRLIKNGILLQPNPTILPQSETVVPENPQMKYSAGYYPMQNWEYVGNTMIDGSNIVTFSFSPYSYDTEEQELYFIDNFTLTLETAPTPLPTGGFEDISTKSAFLKTIVNNPEDVELSLSQIPSPSYYYDDEIEYLIITSEELEPAFHRLLEFKRTKGLYAGIITTQEIDARYDGADMTEKIKKCVYNAFLEYGLKYAILGGDDNLIPSRKCYSEVSSYVEKKIPCDKYFGCFYGDFHWDGNNNGVYGELDDDIDFYESVHISRIPVRTETQANDFINKLIEYETGRTSSTSTYDILTAGVEKWNTYNDHSDSELQGDIMYKRYIQPYWNGNRIRFYDTATDFMGDASYDLIPEKLQEQISNPYMFFSMNTHGYYNCWSCESHNSTVSNYYISDANKLAGNTVPIITTSACRTNGFDWDLDPCLSEAFIRNGSNRVVAYYGSSRYGWGVPSATSIGSSERFEGDFYRYLFGSEIKDKNIGKIISYSKIKNLFNVYNNYNPDTWLQKSLNLMGDAEMPIFTKSPDEFNDISIEYERATKSMTVSSGLPNCRISVWGLSDRYQEVYKNTSHATFENLPQRFAIAVTKQDYKPYFYIINDVPYMGVLEGKAEYYKTGLKNYTINPTSEESYSRSKIEQCALSNGKETLNIHLSDPQSLAEYVEIRNIYGESYLYNLDNKDCSAISIDVSVMNNGVFVISLIGNGEILDTKKIIL